MIDDFSDAAKCSLAEILLHNRVAAPGEAIVSLADITEAWTVVATKTLRGFWDIHLNAADWAALHQARAANIMVTAQRRTNNFCYHLLAARVGNRTSKPAPAAPRRIVSRRPPRPLFEGESA